MGDYSLIVTVKNARIRNAMRNAGFKNVAELCRQSGTSQSDIGNIINLKMTPMDSKGQWRKCVVMMSDALGVLPDDLFSEAQRVMTLRTNQGETSIEESQMQRLVGGEYERRRALEAPSGNPEEEQIASDIDKAIDAALHSLTERESRIVRARMNGETLEQIGVKEDISGHRVRQIEQKAYRRLRGDSTFIGMVRE